MKNSSGQNEMLMRIEWKKPSDEMSREFYKKKRDHYIGGLFLGAFVALMFDLMLIIGGLLTSDDFVGSLEIYILAILIFLAWIGWLVFRMRNLSIYRRKAFGYLKGTVVDKDAERMLMDRNRMNYYVTLRLEEVGSEWTVQTSKEDFYDSKMGTVFYATHFNSSDDPESVDWAFRFK